MTNNDIFRRIRYTFDLKDNTIVDIFALAEVPVTQPQVTAWLKKDEDDAFVTMKNRELAAFLNGFISFKRGKRRPAACATIAAEQQHGVPEAAHCAEHEGR